MIDVKLSIVNSKPEIFRIIRVDENINLQLFHEVIQAAFEWSNMHSHFYNADKSILKNEEEILLGNALNKWESLIYVYDLADFWTISISLLATNSGELSKKPVCLQGQGKSPPEDSGGIINYCEVLELLAKHNKGDRQYPLIADWLGENYNPNEFNCEQVNLNFKNLVL
ncbi:MAG: plasmid pRiA4b ORF-3 family protein [Tenuifilum sp.]|uniref:plasmid pRiA4b ORF-3 family protein n=1 Tax=Tenuifilum sp. TaxID=2760880 RepID=UPI001B6E7426|nr:plasmid pRiA4b ORF-3 family protein [Bacteroidales bacterium]HOK61434.1 plasmid pRiA4b ORF-3 family protein [Tenuifilum sp.]MBP9028689.1 plasmid pRiA4b ORF-3 family protein [Bacteroidales bacterium]HOK86134.1 plasmid pRiA4b ORF-3 family protein [Tenuifilum sp.]HON70018.1 plasmid pRiA4b ORF-3 family protein [Tenuifilum sp.]